MSADSPDARAGTGGNLSLGVAAGCFAVVITYQSTQAQLEMTLRSILGQVAGIVVVDNSDEAESLQLRQWLAVLLGETGAQYDFLSNGRNIGIAAAQNRGFERAVSLGAEYVMFADHDTYFPDGTVEALMQDLLSVEARGKTAAIGPAYINIHEPGMPEPFFIRHLGWRFKRIYPGAETVPVGHVIASGMVVPCDVFFEVGGFAEGLFIDWVDIEWCLRAGRKGYQILGCGRVCLQHALGDRVVQLGQRYISVHSPFRHYHMVRNAFFLARSRETGDLRIRVRILYSALRFVTLLPLISYPPSAHAKACFKGILHGVFWRIPL